MTSRYREPFNSLHPMFCASYFSSDISYLCLRLYRLPILKLSEKTVDGTKPVEAKDRVNDYETYESEE